jgi:hypothetical protein
VGEVQGLSSPFSLPQTSSTTRGTAGALGFLNFNQFGERPDRWQAPRACKRRKASSVTRHGRHRSSPALHVTRKTRSRRLAVAPLHHGAPRCDGCYTPRQTVKASPHRHKWMLSHGAPAPLTHGISIVQAFHSAKTAADNRGNTSSTGWESPACAISLNARQECRYWPGLTLSGGFEMSGGRI